MAFILLLLSALLKLLICYFREAIWLFVISAINHKQEEEKRFLLSGRSILGSVSHMRTRESC